ncbi:MAG: leucine-rich repeat protein [Lachnospiraceae bacterium]|nr:leucine-rich repeat protein [Lachnospiraceae bacterium]
MWRREKLLKKAFVSILVASVLMSSGSSAILATQIRADADPQAMHLYADDDGSGDALSAELGNESEQIVNGDFESGDFTGWTLLDGTAITDDSNQVGVVSGEKTYWGTRNMYMHGNYCMRGEAKENQSGAIRSSSFTLGGDGYISFMIGAAATEDKGCIRLYLEKEGSDELVKTYTNKNWSDPKTGLTLIRVFDHLEQYIGKKMYFVIENGAGAGFSFINADDFRTSLTRQQVIDLQDAQLDEIKTVDDEYSDYIIGCYKKNGIINDIVIKKDIPDVIEKYAGLDVNFEELIKSETEIVEGYTGKKVDIDLVIKSVLFNDRAISITGNEVLKEGSYKISYSRSYDGKTEDKQLTINVVLVDQSISTIENGDFETGDLSGWEVINPDVWTKNSSGKYEGVVSADTYWNEKLPYNQGGEYHLNGWAVTGTETDEWGIRSSVFTLAGSGWISVKMGGNSASFRVYKLDGTLIGSYGQCRFSDTDFPFVGKGSWADMGRYFVDLSAYKGQTLYLELRDNKINGPWAVAFFDDVVTYYDNVPDVANGYDTVVAPVSKNGDAFNYGNVNIPWTNMTYEQDLVKLSFEDEGFLVSNMAGKKEKLQLQSVFKDPAYQSEPVNPYRPKGVNKKALNFDGYSNYVELNERIDSSTLTVDAYICPRAFMWDAPGNPREEQIAQVVAGSYNTRERAGFLLGITKHGYLTYRIGTGSEWLAMTSDDGKQVPLYQWSRITGVYNGDAGIMQLYLNGELAGSKKVEKNAMIASSNRPIRIGKGSESIVVADDLFDGSMFPGLIDEVFVTQKAMTADEIAQSAYELPKITYQQARAQSDFENDYYRPTYHAMPPANWMNEPHALFEYNGKWHLFYQSNQEGPYWHNISWGHWVSDDMVSWKYVKDAVVPTQGTISPDGVWTGNVIFSSDKKPMLLITAGDDSRPNNGSNQHVGIAMAENYDDPELTEWKIVGFGVAQTAEMGTPGEFRDAQAFGIGDKRYMVVGGADNGRGVAHVFVTDAKKASEWKASCESGSKNGLNWTYMGSLLGDYFNRHEYKGEYGRVWEMPNLVPLRDADGKETNKYLFVFSPQHGDNDVWYFIGSFDQSSCRFIPDFEEAKRMDYGDNIYTGPTVYVNPSDGKVYICGIMQENAAGENFRTPQDHYKAGWAFYAALPRELYLKKDNSLGIRNIDTTPIEGNTILSVSDKSVAEVNTLLKDINSDTVKIEYTFTNASGSFGFDVKKSGNSKTRFFVDDNSVGIDAKSGEFRHGNTVKGTLYVDKCSVEAYVDEAITVSASKFIRGGEIEVFGNHDVRCCVKVIQMNRVFTEKQENYHDTGDGGNTGDSGNTGGSGNTGDSGNTGGGGNTGDSGNTGDGGNTGDSGNTGDAGNTGDRGTTEDSGNTGNTGKTGETVRKTEDAKAITSDLKLNEVISHEKGNFKVIGEGKVSFVSPRDKTIRSFVIPKTIVVNDKKYQVTEIGEKAFFKCMKLKKVTIPETIEKIGKKAFYKCRKLESVRIKTGKLKKNSIKAKAFGKTGLKIKFRCPKKKLRAYRRYLKKAGASKLAVYTK